MSSPKYSSPSPPSKSDNMSVIHRIYRRVHMSIHFDQGYNFPLFVILAGALMGFTLARFQYLSIDDIFVTNTIPSDALHYTRPGGRRIAIILHLATILPAGFLVCFQFVHIIRHKFLLFHRLNGYTIILLLLTSEGSACVLIPTAAGGHPSTQVGIGFLIAATTISVTLSYINIKRLQIDQHRAWMLRTWVYAGSIISLRLIMLAANRTITDHYPARFNDVMTCKQIFSLYQFYGAPDQGNPTPFLYPACKADPLSETKVVVPALLNGRPECSDALTANTFGASLWVALILHILGVETYLRLTPRETERLRQVSFERQLERGMRRPGMAGLTVERFGDAEEWKPKNIKMGGGKRRDVDTEVQGDEGSE